MSNDPIGDELHRLSEEFRKLAGLPLNTNIHEEISPKHLTKFGLTLDEAKAFLKNEPNYIRRKVTDDKSDDKVTEPNSIIVIYGPSLLMSLTKKS